MTFEIERIRKGDAVMDSENYKTAMTISNGIRFDTRWIDRGREMELYCLSVNGNEERPPGEYLLFIRNQLVRISAYERTYTIPGTTRDEAVSYRVCAVVVPEGILSERAEVLEGLKAALTARAKSRTVPAASVGIEIMCGYAMLY